MPQYNGIETQKLFRQVEHGQYRSVPGGELIERLYAQLRLADELIVLQENELKLLGRARPELSAVYLEAGKIMPTADNPTAAGAPMTAVAPPVRLPLNIHVPPPAPGLPSTGGSSAYLGGARTEAPPPIPFSQTPEGLQAAAENPPETAKKGRRKKAT